VPASTHAAHPADRLIPLAQLEDDYLRGVVATHTSDRRRLAQALGISERALYRKLVRLRRGD
jgi:transcriptional regulator with PAS, ATPase and Fis domain